MEPKKWIAQWIEYNPEPLKTNPVFKNNAQIFYKKFNLTKQPQKAFIDICGLGFYYLKINGVSPSDALLNPAFSAYDKTVYYTVEETSGLFTDITKPINDGYPALYMGNMPDFEGGTGAHGVVVYGTYDTGSVLCHYGWPGYSQVIMSSLGLFEKAGTISIYNHSNHFHHAYFMLNGTPYCGCGLEMMC